MDVAACDRWVPGLEVLEVSTDLAKSMPCDRSRLRSPSSLDQGFAGAAHAHQEPCVLLVHPAHLEQA